MRRCTLITDFLSGSELSSPVPPVTPRPWRSRALLVSALLLACGCQSGNSLTRFFNKSKPDDLSSDQKKSVLAILDGDDEKAGLPTPSKSKSQGGTLDQLLDKGQDSLAAYYKQASPAHLTEAHRCYEQALAQEPGHAESHHGLAIVCDLKKEYDSAELHYRAALDSDPDNGKILGDLGYSYLLQNKLSESERTLVKANKLDPSNTQATKNLAYVYAKQGNYNLADSTFRRVMNEVEVRQEMAQLFPAGRPDMAKEGESGKLPWQKKEGISTNEFRDRMVDARQQGVEEMRGKKSALESASSPALTMEQMKAELVQLAKERDEAYRMVQDRREQASNTPIVMGDPAAQPGQRSLRSNNGQFYADAAPQGQATSQQPQIYPQGKRAANAFFPDRSESQGFKNRNDIQQASGPDGQRSNEHALHENDRGMDPRTGERHQGIEQMEGQQPLLVPNSDGNPALQSDGQNSAPRQNSSPVSEDAKRRAAMAGMGGPEMMFNVPTISVPRVDGGNRLAPGTGSTWNGGQFPAAQRMLPMDAAPHDLNSLMHAPSGEMSVRPNNMGMLNSPSGRSFSDPNFQQRLNPQIPIESPLGSQGLNYQEQANPSQRQGPPQYPQPQYQQQQSSYESPGNSSPSPGNAVQGFDPRSGINADLQQYGQTMQYNSAQQNSNGWNHTPTPANGLPNQPQVGSPNQLMSAGWNQQQLTPRITPPPYQGRSSQSGDEQSSSNGGYGSSNGDSRWQGGSSDQSGFPQSGGQSAEPPAIYSPGAQVPAEYNSGNRASGPYGQGYNGPRIIPAGR